MYRSGGDMSSPRSCFFLFLALQVTLSYAGPLGPLPNVTSADLGLKEGSCALGDVVYMSGDEFPGTSACERCTCAAGEVQCQKQRCEPRPGCKAVHRPDHCCPTYQCECEQEGRVYGNGEKLVDPQDPCRVCYCQGGEVVCRRIACFVRDDCQPRLVPGRCCPEYDNCPLRGVTSVHGIASSTSSTPAAEVNTSANPVPVEQMKPEITIKEITPVSEIPVITDVKIKEILPSPHMEGAEYSSSKSPLIPREVTSEQSVVDVRTEATVSAESPETKTSLEDSASVKDTNDSPPSRISFSTQDSLNSEIYPSNVPNIILMGPPSQPIAVSPVSTKAPVIEEEDPSLFDHNPAFPPIPDDLSVLGNHDDEIMQEQNMDNEHLSNVHDVVTTNNKVLTESPAVQESSTTILYVTNGVSFTTENLLNSELTSARTSTKGVVDIKDSSTPEGNPMINLRSVLPTQILNIPSFISDETTDDAETTTDIPATDSDSLQNSKPTYEIEAHNLENNPGVDNVDGQVQKVDQFDEVSDYKEQNIESTSKAPELPTTNVDSQNQPSSIAIETSDQNPHEVIDKNFNEKTSPSTDKPLKISSESYTIPRLGSGSDTSLENYETTEFILTSFGSQETATDAVELIKVVTDNEKNAPIIEPPRERKNNVLNDLISLVSDVASISEHTDSPIIHAEPRPTTISDSEELIPVNIGYKSKNNNWNLNSITEVPLKTKGQTTLTKPKNVEIEDDETDSITDSPPPNDKVEPTTKRPIIDNVSDSEPQNNTGNGDSKKDIEIITKSYVPTINRRPTKVVMENKNDQANSDVTSESANVDTNANASDDKPSTKADEPSAPVDDATEQPGDTSSFAP